MTDYLLCVHKKLHENDISARMIYNDPIISKDPKNFPNSIDLIQNSISLPIYHLYLTMKFLKLFLL